MLDFNSFNFSVEAQPIFDKFGNEIQGNQAVVRTDTNEVLGVHGSRYNIVKHDDVVNSILDAVNASQLSRDYTVDVRCIDSGRKLRGEILFNDLVVEPHVGDIVKYRINFFNSYDASWSFSQAADALRLWCMNGCTTPMGIARTKYKHTRNINVDASAAQVKQGFVTFLNNRDEWERWSRAKIERSDAELFFKKTIAKGFTRQELVSKTNEKQLENLLGIYDDNKRELGSNKWALYNAMTYWSTHTSELSNPEVARRNREDAVAKAMTHRMWAELENV